MYKGLIPVTSKTEKATGLGRKTKEDLSLSLSLSLSVHIYNIIEKWWSNWKPWDSRQGGDIRNAPISPLRGKKEGKDEEGEEEGEICPPT